MKIFLLCFLCFGSVLVWGAEPIQPLPVKVDYDRQKALLGKKLFSDPILSRNNTIACVHCHDLQHGGDDGLRFSFGIEGREGHVNAPTVYNSRYNFRQFWDGRARDLKEQALGPMENPHEMDQSVDEGIIKLKADAKYRQWFARLYPEGITRDTVADAIVEFEKALVTPNAPFDKYLRGDKAAMTKVAKKGYSLFKSKGCILCHNGMNIGGNFYNKFGIFEEAKGDYQGRYALTHREEDRMVFKVPSLRNIALTTPYMHDGETKTLEEAIKIMSDYQLGREVTEEEIRYIAAFLKSLSGTIPEIVGER